MRLLRTGLLALCAAMLAAAALPAQQVAPDNPRRAQLEEQLRMRIAGMIKERVGLDDDQLQRLGRVNEGMDTRRRALVEQERDIRIGLRQEVMLEQSSDQQRVARLLDQLLAVQRQRLELVHEEQRALAEFMTPVQRAKYMAVQEQVHRAVEEMRRNQRQPGQQRPGQPRPGRRPPRIP